MMKVWIVATLLLVLGSLAISQAELRYQEDARGGRYYENYNQQQPQKQFKARYESEPERKSFLDGLREKAASVGRATYHNLRGPRKEATTYETVGKERQTIDMRDGRWREWSASDMNVAGGPAHDLSDAVKETGHDIKEAVKDTARGAKDTTVDAGRVVKEDVKDMGHTAAEHGRDLKEDLRDIKDATAAKARKLRGAVHDVRTSFKESARDFKDAAVDAAVETGYKVHDKLADIKDAALETGHRMKEVASDAKEAAGEAVKRWAEKVEDKVVDAGSRVKQEVRTLKHAAEDTGAQMKEATIEKTKELRGEAKEAAQELEEKVESKYGRFKECLCDAKDQLMHGVDRAKKCVCDVYNRVTGRFEERNGFERIYEEDVDVVPELNIKEEIGHVRETLPLHTEESDFNGALLGHELVETLKHHNAELEDTRIPFDQATYRDEVLVVTINEEGNEPTLRKMGGGYVRESILDEEPSAQKAPEVSQHRADEFQFGHSRQRPLGVTDLLRSIKDKITEKYRNYKNRITNRLHHAKENTAEVLHDTLPQADVDVNVVKETATNDRSLPRNRGEAYAYYDATKLEPHPHAFELFAVAYKRGADLYEEARKKIGELEEPHATPEMRQELAREAMTLFKDSLQAVEEAEEQMSRRLAHLRRMTKPEYESTRSVGDLAYEGAIDRAEEELYHARKLIATLFDQLDLDLPTEAR